MASVSFPIIADIAPARSSTRRDAPAREDWREDEKFSVRDSRRAAQEPREFAEKPATLFHAVEEPARKNPDSRPNAEPTAPQPTTGKAPTETAQPTDADLVASTPDGTSKGLIAGIAGSHPGTIGIAETPTIPQAASITASQAVTSQNAAATAANTQAPSNQTNPQAAARQATGIPSSGQQQTGNTAHATQSNAQSEQAAAQTDSLKTAPGATDSQPGPAALQTAAAAVIGRPGQGATTSSDGAKSGSAIAASKTATLDQQPTDVDGAGGGLKKPEATFATGTTTAPNVSDAASKPTLPQSSSQIMAQAIASTPTAPAATPDLTPTFHTAPVTSTGDTLGVSHSFNAEMRAAIDAPTQSAAYTARGAMTPQPVVEQIAMQISRAADQNIDRMTVHLKPAELGKVTIELEVGPDHRLHAVISAERSETLDLLQRDAKTLDKALNEAGIKTDSGSLQFNLKGDGGAAGYDQENGGKLHDGAVMLPGETDALEGDSLPAYTPLILPEGRINIQV